MPKKYCANSIAQVLLRVYREDMTSFPASPLTQPTPRPALHTQRSYRLWWVADTSALLAGNFYAFLIPLLLLAATGSPAQAGALAALGLTARTVVTLAGGAMADRRDRSHMIVFGSLLGAILAGTLTLLAFVDSLTAIVLSVAHVAMELRSGYFGSTTNAALKDVVHPDQLGRAMAANQARDSGLALLAAPAAGALLGLGAGLALLCITAAQLIAAGAGRALRAPLRAARAKSSAVEATGVRDGVLAGLRWCFGHRRLRILLLIAALINLGTGGMSTTLIYGLQQRGEAPWVIGLITTAMGVGMLFGSILASRLIERFRTGLLACSCLSVLAAGIVLMGLNTQLWWMGTMLALAFLSVPALNAGVGGYFLATVPHELAGRASSILLFMALVAAPLAPILAGLGLQLLGLSTTLLCFGALVALAAVAAWGSRSIRTIPRPDQWQEPTPHDAMSAATLNHEHPRSEAKTSHLEGEIIMKTTAPTHQTRTTHGSPAHKTSHSEARQHHAPFAHSAEFRRRKDEQRSTLRQEQWIYL